MPQVLSMSDAIRQIGTSGLKRQGALVFEEFLTELRGNVGRAKYREMTHDARVKQGLRAIKWRLLTPDWRVEPGEGPDAEKAAEHLESCKDDMSHSFREFLRESLSCLEYGSSYCQVVYKRRVGPDEKDPSKRSKYTDGLVGWRKYSFRGQETWDGWEWDPEDGDLLGLKQFDMYTGFQGIIPLSQSLLFRVEGRMTDPEGESMLRSAYIPWRLKRDMQLWEAIRAERDATGIPVFEVQDGGPNLWDDVDPDLKALYQYLQNAGTALRLDEQVCVITPAGIKFRLEKSPGAPSIDPGAAIQRYNWEILSSMLCQFLELGMAEKGSYSKSASDQDFFLAAMEGILQHVIAETINRYEVPRLFKLNAGSFRLDSYPRFVPGELSTMGLEDLAEPLSKLATAGLITPGPAVEQWLRERARLPEEEGAEQGGMVAKARKWFRRGGGNGRDRSADSHYSINDALALAEEHGNGEEN